MNLAKKAGNMGHNHLFAIMYTKAALERYAPRIADPDVRQVFKQRVATIPYRGAPGKEVCVGVELEQALYSKSISESADLAPDVVGSILLDIEHCLLEIVDEADCVAIEELTGGKCMRPAEHAMFDALTRRGIF